MVGRIVGRPALDPVIMVAVANIMIVGDDIAEDGDGTGDDVYSIAREIVDRIPFDETARAFQHDAVAHIRDPVVAQGRAGRLDDDREPRAVLEPILLGPSGDVL